MVEEDVDAEGGWCSCSDARATFKGNFQKLASNWPVMRSATEPSPLLSRASVFLRICLASRALFVDCRVVFNKC